MENQGRERGGGRVVVLVPCPLLGHISPMIELATALHSKGFSITIAHTVFNSPNLSNHPQLTFFHISDGLTDRNTSSEDFPALVSTINTNYEATLKEWLAQMMNQEERRRNEVACIIYDTLMHATETVANHLKIPTIVLRTSGVSAMVVYGSMTRLHEANCFPLQVSGQTFLWVIRSGSIYRSEWIELLPEGFDDVIGERGCIVKWAPLKEVLAYDRVSRFLSHHGWNLVQESVSEGVPMICSPCFGDQKVNARYVSSVWKVGLELVDDSLSRGEIERVVRRLMGGKEWDEMRQRAIDLKKKFKVCVNKGNSFYSSLNDLV